MIVFISSSRIVSQVSDLDPLLPARWARGQIVYFAVASSASWDGIQTGIIGDPQGEAWEVEVLGWGPPRNGQSGARGAIVRILDRKAIGQGLPDFGKEPAHSLRDGKRHIISPDFQRVGAA